MTRKTWLKWLLSLLPFAAFGKQDKKVCFPVSNIWETPQGQYVIALRDELKRLGHWDDLEEDWKDVETAIRNGHMFFGIAGSRTVKTGERTRKVLHTIRPLYFEPMTHPDSAQYWATGRYHSSTSIMVSFTPGLSSRPRL